MPTSNDSNSDSTAFNRKKFRFLMAFALFSVLCAVTALFLVNTLIDTVTEPLHNSSESTSTTVTQDVDSNSANTPPLELEAVN